MTRFVGYIAMSIDGRIADGAGGMTWLDRFNDSGTDYGFAEFYAGIDTLVMGRKTYEFADAQPHWPYKDRKTYVVTSRLLDDPAPEIESFAPDFEALRRHLSQDDAATVWIVGGGETQRGALDADMFDELQLFVMPLVLGSGPLVFADGRPTNGTLTDHKILPGGVVRLTYEF